MRISATLARLPFAVVFSKMDLHPAGNAPPAVEAPGAWGTHHISAVTGQGLSALLEGCWRQLEDARKAAAELEDL